MEVVATVMVGCLLIVSASIALFILFKFRKEHGLGLEEEHCSLRETRQEEFLEEAGRY